MVETLRRQEDRGSIGREQASIDSQIAHLRRIRRGETGEILYPSLGSEIKFLTRETRLIQREINRKRHGNRTGAR